ncbi:MAG TPA: GNAT family N-acetyltransferase [Terracidiphilus sp.]
MIRRTTEADFEAIWQIVNDAAHAYKGIIPADRWHDPYMTREELSKEIAAGVEFWCVENGGIVDAVMGIQPVRDVFLIRHAYTRTAAQGRGYGAQLLAHLHAMAVRPMLIGTWVDATWAIRFYLKHGFKQVELAEKERLLRIYWSIPERQVETSVVLADEKWFAVPGAPA